jgi:DNA polymerase
MDILTLDFETFYSKDFSLSKIQTDAYILDPQFEIIGVSVMRNDDPPQWFSGPEIETIGWLHVNYDWENSAVRCHNTLFDGFILAQRCGIKPKLWMDTLAQARMLMPWLPSHSLANIAKYFNLPAKGTAVLNALGLRRENFSAGALAEYAAYCDHDTWLCNEIGKRLDPDTPALEMKLIDMTIRMFTEPSLVGDVVEMERLYKDEVQRKETLLIAAETNRDIIMSNDKFAAALEELGVEPPRKVSKTTGKETYAFAKSDKNFTDLLDHELPEVQCLVAARVGVKTTIAETRALRFLDASKRGPLPVYLNFWGAKTTGRYSGGNQVNWQNLPARGPSAGLRKALRAPEGHTVLVGDSSNIELRVVMAVAGHFDVLEQLRQGVDLYCAFASKLFNRTITKADKPERELGKAAMLSLQYGAGAARFCEMVRVAARTNKNLTVITEHRAQEIVDLYRSTYHKVVALWKHCGYVVLPAIANGTDLTPVDVNGWCVTQRGGFGRLGEPGVVYHDLRNDAGDWTYLMGRARARIHGPKLVENLCQHLAMKIVMWQTARINQRYPVALSVHDEAVCVVKNELLDEARTYMEECLAMAPKWCRDVLPVACETGVGVSYGDAK